MSTILDIFSLRSPKDGIQVQVFSIKLCIRARTQGKLLNYRDSLQIISLGMEVKSNEV